MGQQEALIFLKREYEKDKDAWFSCKDISISIGAGIASVGNSMASLRRTNFIRYQQILGYVGNRYKYRYNPNNNKKKC